MSVCGSLLSSMEESIIDLVLRRGCPVVEDGKENPTLAEHGYASSAWRDIAIQGHVKGGYAYDETGQRWVSYNGCGWVLADARLTGDSIDEVTGKLHLEVEGVICNCGQYAEKRVRYTGNRDEVIKEITSGLGRLTVSKMA